MLKRRQKEKAFDVQLGYRGQKFIPISRVSREKTLMVRAIRFAGRKETLQDVFGTDPLTKKEAERRLKEFVRQKNLEKRYKRKSISTEVSIPSEFVRKTRLRKGKVAFGVTPVPKGKTVRYRLEQPVVGRRTFVVSRYVYIPLQDLDDPKTGEARRFYSEVKNAMMNYPKGTAEVYAKYVFEAHTAGGRIVEFPSATIAYSTDDMRVNPTAFMRYLWSHIKKEIAFMVKIQLGEEYEDKFDEHDRIVGIVLVRYDVNYQRLTRARRKYPESERR
jgi:hypothetical protein